MLSEPAVFLVEPRPFTSSPSPVAAARPPHHVLPTSNVAVACEAPGLEGVDVKLDPSMLPVCEWLV